MMARLRWLAAGAVGGAIGTIWLRRRATRVGTELARRLSPRGLAERAVDMGSGWLEAAAKRVREAILEGRTEARRREAELRGALVQGVGEEEYGALERARTQSTALSPDDGPRACRAQWGDLGGRRILGEERAGEGQAQAMVATR